MLYLKLKIYEKGYTLRDIALRFKINEQTLSNWVNGKNTEQLRKFIDILKFLDFSNDDLNKL